MASDRPIILEIEELKEELTALLRKYKDLPNYFKKSVIKDFYENSVKGAEIEVKYLKEQEETETEAKSHDNDKENKA